MYNQEKQKIEKIVHEIEYLKYCNSKIDELKSSIYHRASILVVVISIIIPAWISIIRGLIEKTSYEIMVWKVILCVLCCLFIFAFLLTVVFGIKCLIPLKSNFFLLKLLNSSRNKTSRNKVDKISINELARLDPSTEIKQILEKYNTVDTEKVIVFTTFAHICDLTEGDFERMVRELDAEQILNQLISATYNLSHITKRRYSDLLLAYKWLLMNIIIFIAIFLLEIIISIF